MSARIRGHYRIDSSGRVLSMLDVNSAAITLHRPQPSEPEQLKTRMVRLAVYGLIVGGVCVGAMLAMPRVERSLMASQYARMVPLRRMHGRHMQDLGERMLRDE